MTEQTQEAVQAEEITEDATVTETTEEGVVAEATGEETPAETPAWAEKRFKKLAAQKHDAIGKAEQANREAEYWRNKAQEAPQKQAPANTVKPTREQFDFDDEKYLDALSDWKLDEREAKRSATQETRQREEAEYNQVKGFEASRDETVNKGREKYDDYDQVVFSLPVDVMTQEVAQSIFETDNPAEISYFLGQNPEKAVAIAQMSPIKRAIELGRIEGTMKVNTKQTTQAPPPIKPVGSGGSVEKSPATMTNAEYRLWSRQNRSK